MRNTLNKSKWPYLLLLIVCMIAASTKSDKHNKAQYHQPLIVKVQVEKQPQVASPYSDWLVQIIANEGEQ